MHSFVQKDILNQNLKRGFFVCQVEELAELHIPVKIEEEEEEIRPEKIPYDFSSAGVDMEQFPYHIWRKLLKENHDQ